MKRAIITGMGVGDWHLPDADVAEHVAQEFAEGEGHDEPEVVAPGDECAAGPPHAPEVEERPREEADGRQLDDGHGYRVREVREQGFGGDVARGGDHVPEQAEEDDRDELLAVPPLPRALGHPRPSSTRSGCCLLLLHRWA
jgi:hypothetical protein